MDKESRLGKFDKWGYKNSFSKGELARELTYMNRDYEKLEQQCKKQREVIDKAMNLIKKYGKYDGEKCTQGFQMWSADFNKILDILKEVSE